MTSFPPDGHFGSTPDPDLREALIQAMDNFANDTHPPTFDGTAILRRTRRRRALLAVTASAAAIVLTAGTAFALHGSDQSPVRPASAPPVASGTPSPAPPEPTSTASPAPDTVSPESPTGSAMPSPGTRTEPAPGDLSVTVPAVLGMPQGQAEKLLTEVGLKIDHIQDFTDWKTPAGAVISSDPRPGTVVPPGTAVTLFVSKGKP
ncbi:PASTA domain-containing protein [Kitasatospora sp. NPDC017646]|uniref:PASTA domain-containing protein n=1 Tax=Kitasatospora sp. NPDC017646 TaxID=3364024 RepID=UPI0037B9E4E5